MLEAAPSTRTRQLLVIAALVVLMQGHSLCAQTAPPAAPLSASNTVTINASTEADGSPSALKTPQFTPPATADNASDSNDWTAALATILAAMLGFAAALMVERQSWQRRKAEQVREAQLNKLLLAARNLQQAGNRIKDCRRMFLSAQENAAAPNAATLNVKAATEAAATASDLEECLKELTLELLELRVLRVADDSLTEISTLIAKIQGAVLLLRRAGAKDNDAVSELLRFDLSMEGLINKAIESLRQK